MISLYSLMILADIVMICLVGRVAIKSYKNKQPIWLCISMLLISIYIANIARLITFL